MSRDYTKATTTIIIIVIVALAAYDILPAFNAVHGDTISEVIRYGSLRWWVLPAGFGILMGHFFSPLRWRAPWWMSAALLPYGAALTFINWRGWIILPGLWAIGPLFLLHLVIGGVMWSQGTQRKNDTEV